MNCARAKARARLDEWANSCYTGIMWWRTRGPTLFDNFEAHANQILAAARLLNQLFTTHSDPKKLSREISEREQAADLIRHDVLKMLNRDFIFPIDREDSLYFIKTLDDVIDLIHHSAEAIADIFCIETPSSFAVRFSDIILKACEELPQLCRSLGCPSRHLNVIGKICSDIHHWEKEGDQLRKEALHSLFVNLTQQQVSVADYLAWSKTYSLLENVTDKIEECADVAEQITMKYS